jgi:ribosomal protein S21
MGPDTLDIAVRQQILRLVVKEVLVGADTITLRHSIPIPQSGPGSRVATPSKLWRLENALRRFKRKVVREDIIKEIKRHSFYLKPGEKKRVKSVLVIADVL